MSYLERAIEDGYAYLSGNDNKQKITYVTSGGHSENYNDPEEKVRAEFWAELIYKYEYPVNRIKIEVVVPYRLPNDGVWVKNQKNSLIAKKDVDMQNKFCYYISTA